MTQREKVVTEVRQVKRTGEVSKDSGGLVDKGTFTIPIARHG